MTIIIPAYKPDQKLIDLLKKLKECTTARLLVVNDGSGEAYEDIFQSVRELGCTLLCHPVNKGKGAALKTGFRFLLEEGKEKEAICTADADGQHLPGDILRCMEEAKAHPEALVLGSRMFKGDVPARSRIGNAISRFTFHLLMGTKVYDTQTGLRAFSAGLLNEMLSTPGDRYEYEMQVLCDMAKHKIPIREVEIETVYLEENKSSHFNPLRDAVRVYGLLLKNALGRAFQPVIFLLSSCLAFFLDVIVYYLLFNFVFSHFIPSPEDLAFCSLLIARAISSVVNFTVNGKMVFHNLKHPARSFVLYVLLVVGIFFGNHVLNTLFLVDFALHEIPSLILAQCICFPVSFLIQKYIVFPKTKETK